MSETETVDQRLSKASTQYIDAIAAISENTFVQDGLVKAAVTDFIWALFERFPESRFALAEQLEGFDGVVRDEAVKNDKAKAERA